MLLYDWIADVAAKNGSGKALVYRDTYLSWRGLIHRVDRRAQEMHAMGVGRGQWVGLMLGNVPDLVILSLALSKLKAVPVPLDPTTGNRELEMVLEAAPLKALVTRPRGGETGQANAAAVPTAGRFVPPAPPKPPVPPTKFVPENRRRLQGTLLTCNLYKRASFDATTAGPVASVQFTADVGGDPKGVLRTDDQMEAAARAIVESLEMTAEDRVLCTVPLHHSYGFDFGLLATLSVGATLFLEDEVAPKRIAKLVREHSIDLFPGTPSLFGALNRVPTVKPLRIPRARYLASGSALPTVIADAFAERWGVRLIGCYHTTEAGPVALDRPGKNPETVGRPLSGVEVRVAGPNGERITYGVKGPVWVRSPVVSTASVPRLENPVRMVGVPVGSRDPDGWFRTGDLGTLDRNGRLALAGREDDLVKVDGKRVALGEVEGCLESFPKVKAAQALVVTDDLGGPMVVARVVRAGTVRAEEIIDYCARNLAPYKVPRQIEFCEQLS